MSKQLQAARTSQPGGGAMTDASSLTVSYRYNAAGKVSATTYPVTMIDPNWTWAACNNYYVSGCIAPNQGVSFTLKYGFDSMGRANSLTDNYDTSISADSASSESPGDWTLSTTTWVQNVQYDYAGRMSGMQYLRALSDDGNGNVRDTYTTEAVSYNPDGQLASLNFSGGVSGGVQYNYSATQNNGQITQAVDTISGETVGYQYDALKRLTSASSTPNAGSQAVAWNEAFQYDGFGNLTSKTLNGTAGPIPVNAVTNQLSNAIYDLNGNMTSGAGATLAYDVSNRLTSAQEVSGGIEYYGYAADNKQIYRLLPNGNEEYTFYGAQGEKLGVFSAKALGNPFTPLRSNIYFAGKMIWSDGAPAYQDRLGTNRASGARFYPFGDEITSTSNDREKFQTYTRDSYTGLDYADQRYFASTYGRFNTPDPFGGSANPAGPMSWNRYTYSLNDPINMNDPTGQCGESDGVLSTDDYAEGISDCPVLSVDLGETYGLCAGMAMGFNPSVPCASDGTGGVVAILSLSDTFGATNDLADCAKALARLVRATNRVLVRIAQIVADVKGLVKNGRTDPGHIQALAEAVNGLANSLAQVKRSCITAAGAAAAIAAAEAALEAAAPYLVVAAI